MIWNYFINPTICEKYINYFCIYYNEDINMVLAHLIFFCESRSKTLKGFISELNSVSLKWIKNVKINLIQLKPSLINSKNHILQCQEKKKLVSNSKHSRIWWKAWWWQILMTMPLQVMAVTK